MSNYKVSLIIPCYNIENISSEEDNPFNLMIDSIINQTFGLENIEVLLVDDASTDNTREILSTLHEEYPNFKVILLEENTGRPSIPRNIGIDNATSDYIMFLDQDDKMNLSCVETLYNEIISNNADMVKSNYSILSDDKILKYDTGRNERIIIKPRSTDMIYLVSHFIWGSIYKRDFLNKHNIRFPDTQAEDNLFLSKCYNFTDKDIISLNDYYSIIYTANNSNSLSHTFTLKQISDYECIFDKTLNSYIENKQSNEFIILNLERYLIILIGSLIRSTKPYHQKKKMIEITRKFINKYKAYNINLPLYWKIFYILIKYQLNHLINLSSSIINLVFENKIFKKLFRNTDYS